MSGRLQDKVCVITGTAGAAVLGIPINVLWFLARPEELTTAEVLSTALVSVSIREAVRDKRFWLVAAAIGSAAIPIGGFLTHLQPLLIGRGVSALTAASFGSVFVIAIGAGRLVVGSLLDRLYAPFVAAGSLCLSGPPADVAADMPNLATALPSRTG